MKTKISYDYALIIITALLLFLMSCVCIYSMFYFKTAYLSESWSKIEYQNMMNRINSPLLIGLLIVLSLCIPKRILPSKFLVKSAIFSIFLIIILSFLTNIITALTIILIISLIVQIVVLVLTLIGAELHFEQKGYWIKVGSSLIHLGFILFVLDFMVIQYTRLHLYVFWLSTLALSGGCFISFYVPDLKSLRRNANCKPLDFEN